MAAAFAQIKLDAQAMDCCFHHSELCITIALINGSLETYSLSHCAAAEGDAFVTAEAGWSSDVHSDSCRCVTYIPTKDAVFSGSKDGSLVVSDVKTGEEVFRQSDAHEGAEISSITCTNENLVASGDEEGSVTMWDLRQDKSVATFHEHDDFISDFAFHGRDNCLVSTSGDGTMAIYDLKKSKRRARSESDADDEYLSCQLMKNGKKVVVGTQMGVLSLFSWGYFNDCSDRFPGHPQSIDAIVKFDEDTVLTGAGDGAIRILSILPNKLVGVLGVHEEDAPVERVSLSHDKLLLASVSHDSIVKLWSLKCLQEDDADEDEEEPPTGPGERPTEILCKYS